jgi:hypothetical protein
MSAKKDAPIGPGSRKLIRQLDSVKGDYFNRIPTPNGWGLNILRVGPPAGRLSAGSDGATSGLFEVSLIKHGHICLDGPILQEPRGWQSAADIALLLHDIYDLPEAPNE